MSNIMRVRALRLSVIALYALAMALVGAARHDDGPAVAAMRSIAYALPGGETALLCGHGGSGQGDQDAPGDRSCCDACLISHAPGLGGVAIADIAHPPVAPPTYVLASMVGSIGQARIEPASRGPPIA